MKVRLNRAPYYCGSVIEVHTGEKDGSFLFDQSWLGAIMETTNFRIYGKYTKIIPDLHLFRAKAKTPKNPKRKPKRKANPSGRPRKRAVRKAKGS